MKTTMRARKRMRPPRPLPSGEAGTGGGTIPGEMRSLVEEIVGSYDARMERLAAIRDETAEQLGAFRRRMQAADLRRFLSVAEATRRATTGQLMETFRRARDANAEAWRHLAATMQTKRAEAAR